ncbi:MAG: alkaline phosphatase family protein [Deltaproteobacteria bacterium]|nr:alkaline phosphatase family protein [Deltaproteobacteria bacterium]
MKGESVPRVVVFGMDGADPDLIFPWARAGYLPNIARLMREGAFGRLESTTHPLTPQAWTSMTTGVNPGRHGIFDFGMREDGSYAIRLATSRDRLAPTMFEMLPEPLTCAALNIPLSFPVDPVRGYAVGGMHTPALDTPGAFYPPDLAHALDGYVIDTMVHWYDDKDRFVADVRSMLEARHAAYLRLFDHRPVDLFFAVYVALDRVQHAFWHELTADHRANPGTHTDHGEAIFDIARRLDGCLGDYMERLRPEDHLLLVSDHGFGDLQGDVYLNAWLVDNGFLSFDPQKVRAFQPPPLPEGDDPRHAWHRKLHRGDPTPLPNDDDIRAGRIDPRYKTWDTVDWTRTRAYASGLFGNLWINLRGREPHGAVDPGREYEEVRDDLLGRLSELRHPEDGEPLVTMAARREDLYWGRALERAPDIIVAFRDYAYMTRGATEFFSGDVVGPVVVGHTGNHRLHGIVGLRGPAARRGEAKDSSITQIAATALHLLGAPVPANLDGGVAENLLHDDFLKTRPVIPGPAAAARTPFDPAAASPDMTRVLERLEGLGYLV